MLQINCTLSRNMNYRQYANYFFFATVTMCYFCFLILNF